MQSQLVHIVEFDDSCRFDFVREPEIPLLRVRVAIVRLHQTTDCSVRQLGNWRWNCWHWIHTQAIAGEWDVCAWNGASGHVASCSRSFCRDRENSCKQCWVG